MATLIGSVAICAIVYTPIIYLARVILDNNKDDFDRWLAA